MILAFSFLEEALYVFREVDLCAVIGELISTTLEERGIYLYDFCLAPRKTSMRSGWVNSSLEFVEIWIWYVFLHDCVVYIYFCGSFTLLSNPERCWGFACLRYRVRFRPKYRGNVHSERMHSREIFKWNILLEVLGNGEQIKNLLIDLLFFIFLLSYWGIYYAWQSRLMGWKERILGDSV